jgi:hypothetical protein
MEAKSVENLKIESDIAKTIAEMFKHNAETRKLDAETVKLQAETNRTLADMQKSIRENRWYPVIAFAALVGSVAAVVKVFLH